MKPTGSWTVSSLIAWNLEHNRIIVWSSKAHNELGAVLSIGEDCVWQLETVEDGLLAVHRMLFDDLVRLKRAIALMER